MDHHSPKRMKRKTLKIVLSSLAALVILLTAGFFIYASQYYHADASAAAILEQNSNIRAEGRFTILSPYTPSDTAFIFYPGAKVEAEAYLPMLEKLRLKGVTCVLVEMPFRMAIFDTDAADDVFQLLPDVQNFYIGGHSMGGAMASSYAAGHQDKVKGLILLGAYIYGDYPVSKALTIYGTLNSDLEQHIDYTENIVVIEGGNHAQFGSYGRQKGDPDAAISAEKQQNIAAEAIVTFIDGASAP